MEKKASILFVTGIFLLITAAPALRAQEQPSSGKKTTHIRTITVKDGKEEVFDTVYSGKDVKVFHIDGDQKFNLVSSDLTIDRDTLTEVIEGLPGGGKEIKKVIVMKHQGGRKPVMITETETVRDSGKKVVVYVEDVTSETGDVIKHRPGVRPGQRMAARPFRPDVPFNPGQHMIMMNMRNPNVINLSDPGIISYKKKKLSGGREKITIIRNEVKKAEEEILHFQTGDGDAELRKMNAPRVVREFEIQKKGQGNPENTEKKIEIKTK